MGFLSYQSWLLPAALALATLLAVRTAVWIGSRGAVESTSRRRHELEVLFEPDNGLSPSARRSEHAVDIVAVHGLGSDVERAWRHRPTGRFWLREFLPDDLDQRARIMTYMHDSRWESHTLRKSFDGFAKDLLEGAGGTRACDNLHRAQLRWPSHQAGLAHGL